MLDGGRISRGWDLLRHTADDIWSDLLKFAHLLDHSFWGIMILTSLLKRVWTDWGEEVHCQTITEQRRPLTNRSRP